MDSSKRDYTEMLRCMPGWKCVFFLGGGRGVVDASVFLKWDSISHITSHDFDILQIPLLVAWEIMMELSLGSVFDVTHSNFPAPSLTHTQKHTC